MDRGAWWGHKESDMIKHAHTGEIHIYKENLHVLGSPFLSLSLLGREKRL